MELAQKNMEFNDKEKPELKTPFGAKGSCEMQNRNSPGLSSYIPHKCILFKLLAQFYSFRLLSNLAIAASTEAPLLQTCLTDTDKMMVTAAATSSWVTMHPIETKKEFTALPSTDSRNTELLGMSGASNLIAHYLIWAGTIRQCFKSESLIYAYPQLLPLKPLRREETDGKQKAQSKSPCFYCFHGFISINLDLTMPGIRGLNVTPLGHTADPTVRGQSLLPLQSWKNTAHRESDGSRFSIGFLHSHLAKVPVTFMSPVSTSYGWFPNQMKALKNSW